MKSVYVFLLATFAVIALVIPYGKADPSISVTPSNVHHVLEVHLGNSTNSQPFVAGWMDAGGALFGVSATRVTVSFPASDPLVIQTDNWLSGGMFVVGYGHTPQVDYGFATYLVLDHYGDLYLNVAICKTYEGLVPPPFGPPPSIETLYHAAWSIGGVSPSTPITLTARWDAPNGLIYWDFTVLGNPPFTLPPFNNDRSYQRRYNPPPLCWYADTWPRIFLGTLSVDVWLPIWCRQ